MARVIRDSGWLKQIKQLLTQRKLTIGIHAVDTSRDGTGPTNAEIGFKHEYGIGVPQRSFMRSTYEEQLAAYRKLLALAYARSARSKTVDPGQALKIVGLKVSADMKEKIRDHIPPPNAPATIDSKGSSTPLIDTGQLLNSIDYEVA